MLFREEIKKIIEKVIKKLQEEGFFSRDLQIPEIEITIPDNKNLGDYATNIAFKLAKLTGKNLLDVSDKLATKIPTLEFTRFRKSGFYPIGFDGSTGFINIEIPEPYLQNEVAEILEKKDKYKEDELKKIGASQKVNVEFISANPTGPLTLGNGRGGFCGDVLANVLNKAGYKAMREYYINDVGEQVRKLGHSIRKDELAVYKGKYIDDLLYISNKYPEADEIHTVGRAAAEIILETMIKPTILKMGIKFDIWFSERSLHESGEVKKVSEFLKKKNLAYEQERALWFKSMQFGDDKDRVLVKADGETTYLASDIAYLKDKFSRGFEKLIFFWGADHFGYIERIKAAAVALGYKKEQIDIIIMQLVRLMEAGKEVRMSKRTGIYVAIDELIDEVGLDVARFFFLSRAANTHLDFDMDLAKEQSEKNPVYYVQYAHARICSILGKIGKKLDYGNYELLKEPSELKLIKQLIRLPEIIEDTAKDYQVQRLPQYAVDLATVFHQFYRDCRVISEDKNLTKARLALACAAKIILENTLNLMGISAPEKM